MGQSDLTRLDAARAAYANGHYDDKLEEGRRFQDFMTDQLYAKGIILVGYSSKARNREAENMLGIEIKLDTKFRGSGRLYMETAEKSNPNNVAFVPSGVLRTDNSWLYLIGDYVTQWIFAKTLLRKFAFEEPRRFRSTATPTSLGFLMPLADADRWCAKKYPEDERDGA